MAISTKVIIGVAMAIVLLVVAAVTLAITYSVSINAIRTAGQRLAGSMVDTVSTRVSNYMNTTEEALWNVAKMAMIKGYMLPHDEVDLFWYLKWSVPLRTFMSTAQFNFPVLSLTSDDGGLVVVGQWPVNATWIFAYVLDPHTLAATGNNTLLDFTFRNRNDNSAWVAATMGTGMTPPSYGDQRGNWYYAIRSLATSTTATTAGAPTPFCYWAQPTVETYVLSTGAFVMKGGCTVYNSSGALLGIVSINRPMSGVGEYLSGAASTPRTQLFLLDGDHLLMGASTGDAFTHFYEPGHVPATARGCSTSVGEVGSVTNPISSKVGCRTAAADYSYEPLSEVAVQEPTFLNQSSRDERYGKLSGDTYFYISLRIPTTMKLFTMNLVLFMPENDVLGGIAEGTNIAIILTVAVFAVAAIFANVVVHLVLPPLETWSDEKETTRDSTGFDDLDFTDIQQQQSTDVELNDLSTAGDGSQVDTAYRNMVAAIRVFNKYFPATFIKSLVATNQLCDIPIRPMRCTIMYVDLCDLRTMSDRHPPRLISNLFRMYFDNASTIVMAHGGIIDKFVGDCVMAVFSAPVPIDHHELRAALCGCMLYHETQVDPLKMAFHEVQESFETRIGIATGEAMVGSAAHVSYQVMGDDVNLASRLLNINRQWGTMIMISAATAQECRDWLVLRHVVSLTASGHDAPVDVFEPLGVKPDAQISAPTARYSSRNAARMPVGAVYENPDDETAVNQPIMTLLQRAQRKGLVGAADVEWAAQYSMAFVKFRDRDYAGALQVLRAIVSNPDMPTSAKECVSTMRLISKCDELVNRPSTGGASSLQNDFSAGSDFWSGDAA